MGIEKRLAALERDANIDGLVVRIQWCIDDPMPPGDIIIGWPGEGEGEGEGE